MFFLVRFYALLLFYSVVTLNILYVIWVIAARKKNLGVQRLQPKKSFI